MDDGKAAGAVVKLSVCPEIKRPSATDDVEPEESLEEYYQNTPDIAAEMDELQKLNQQLENDSNER